MKPIVAGSLLPISLVLCSAAFAQTVPSAGSLNQQIERERLPAPVKAAPEIRVEQAGLPPAPAAAGQKIAVKQVRIDGARVYPEAQLLALLETRAEQLTLAELRTMASKITAYYRKNGYFLAQAYLPAQDIKDGVVTIAVLEGRYGEIKLRNAAGVPERVSGAMLAGVNSGDAVAIGPLEQRLLLLSDLPGVNVKSTLVPGASVGASDLIIDLAPGERVTGYADADNQGNRYTGGKRAGVSLQANNPGGIGDLLNLRLQSSFDGMDYARVAYQAQLGRASAGLAYSYLKYALGQDFASLQASGVARTASIYGSYPLLRSRSSNLNLQLHFDDKQFTDRADATASRTDRADATASRTDKSARVAIVSLMGDRRDGFGTSSGSVSFSSGDIDIASAAARAADASSARSNGRFNKLAVNATRLHSLSDSATLQASFSGQLASKNLDTSEKIGLGGVGGVRAYPSGEAYGDQGYVINLEAKSALPLADSVPGRFTVSAFVDHGSVSTSKHAWTAADNRRSLSGIGVGLNWVGPGRVAINATLAAKLGNAVATSAPDSRRRFWLQAVKYF